MHTVGAGADFGWAFRRRGDVGVGWGWGCERGLARLAA